MNTTTTERDRAAALSPATRWANGALFLGGLFLIVIGGFVSLLISGLASMKVTCDPAVIMGCTSDFELLSSNLLYLACLSLFLATAPSIATAVSGRPRRQHINGLRKVFAVLAVAFTAGALASIQLFN